jgi:hypothetical protein
MLMVKCTNCGTSIEPVGLDEYEARLAEVVEQTPRTPANRDDRVT